MSIVLCSQLADAVDMLGGERGPRGVLELVAGSVIEVTIPNQVTVKNAWPDRHQGLK